jgi:porin
LRGPAISLATAANWRFNLIVSATILDLVGVPAIGLREAKMKRFIVLAALLCPAMGLPASAQVISGATATSLGAGAASTVVTPPPPPAYTPQQVEHLLGDWGGIRTSLENEGIYLSLDATAEFAGNPIGGIKQGATSANQVAFGADIDWQRLAGIYGLSTHVIFVSRFGYSDSLLIGDNVAPVQEIYGASGNVLVHLVSAYAEESLFGGRLDIALGQMNVENDFASSPLYCYYMNNDLCGDPKALPGGDVGHSAYPDGVWAGRIRVRPTPDTYVETGAYEVNQGLYTNQFFSTGFPINESQVSGVYVPVEIAYEPSIGPEHLLGHYKIGAGYDSTLYTSFDSATSSLPGQPTPTESHKTQVWVLVDQMLVRQGPGDQDGIIALAAFARNDPNVSTYAQQYSVGLIDRDFWRARPEDAIGLLFNYNALSGPLGKVQSEEAEFGLPFSNGATGVQTHEMVFEANYNIHVYRGCDFRPEFEYILRPNAQSNIHNAAVFGFKANVEF